MNECESSSSLFLSRENSSNSKGLFSSTKAILLSCFFFTPFFFRIELDLFEDEEGAEEPFAVVSKSVLLVIVVLPSCSN